MGLLLIILSFIFMKGNSVKDSESSLRPHCTPLYTPLTDTPFSRCFVGVPASAPCVPRVGYGGTHMECGVGWGCSVPPLTNPHPQEAAPGVWGRSEAGDRGVCEAEVS